MDAAGHAQGFVSPQGAVRDDFELELIVGGNRTAPCTHRGLRDAESLPEPGLVPIVGDGFVIGHGANNRMAISRMSMPFARNLLDVHSRRHNPRDVGARIRAARKAVRLSQTELAAQADITQPTLSSIERGDTKNPEAETILRIAIAVRRTPYYLLWDHDLPDMPHHQAFMMELWNMLDPQQRELVISYAQGLVDAARKAKRQQQPEKPQHPRHTRRAH